MAGAPKPQRGQTPIYHNAMNSKSDRKHLVTRPWRMLRPFRGWRTVLAIGAVAIYTAIFFPLYHLMDGGAAALSVILVAPPAGSLGCELACWPAYSPSSSTRCC